MGLNFGFYLYKLRDLGKDVFQIQFLIYKTSTVLVSLAELTSITKISLT